MRVLLDENLPHDLVSFLIGHEATTVQGQGWAGVKNGELLQLATGHFDAFLTMDRKLERQQVFAGLSFGIIVIRARSNRVQDLEPLIGDILIALGKIVATQIQHVGV